VAKLAWGDALWRESPLSAPLGWHNDLWMKLLPEARFFEP